MMLSVTEAAQLLRRPVRTVRAMLVRGELKGSKHNGAWRIPSEALPVTDERLAEVQRRADDIRAAVEAALPSRVGTKRTKSVADFAPFLAAREVWAGREDLPFDGASVRARSAAPQRHVHDVLPDLMARFVVRRMNQVVQGAAP